MGKFKDKRSRKQLLDIIDTIDLEYQTLSKLSTDRYIENQNLKNEINDLTRMNKEQYVYGMDMGLKEAIQLLMRYRDISIGNRKNLLTIILDDLDDLYLKDKK